MKFENLGRRIDGFFSDIKEWKDNRAEEKRIIEEERRFLKVVAQALKDGASVKWDAKAGRFLTE